MEDKYIPPVPPADLGDAGRELWESVTREYTVNGTPVHYELNGGEIRILKDACMQADLTEYMHRDWVAAGMPTTTKGSRGQDVAHPYIQEIRQHRSETANLLKSLKLPVLEEVKTSEKSSDGKMSRSEAGRKAAAARWDRSRRG